MSSLDPQRRLQDSTQAANASGGQRSMQASSEPPGQSEGVGDGVGDGEGEGVVVKGGRQFVHQVPLHSLHCCSFPAQYSVVSPQYLPSHVQHPAPGDGDGVGLGLGVGEGEGPTVEPMAPTLMSENFTLASACWDSTSLGTPDVMAQVPLLEPGWEPSVG